MQIEKVKGWDFSRVKVKTIGEKWDFYKLVRSYCDPKTTRILDVGTGGGENFLTMAPYVKAGIGFDVSLEIIRAAKENKKRKAVKNIDFMVADATEDYPFDDESFDVVSCRHAQINFGEVYRVLKGGGVFLTQQVDEADKSNIKKIFGRGQGWGRKNETLMNEYTRKLKAAGFGRIRAKSYNATEYYKTPEDILFVLVNTPIIPDFDINNPEDQQKFDEFVKLNSSPEGIKTNSYRFLIIAEKGN